MANETIKVTAQGEDKITPVFKQMGANFVLTFKKMTSAVLSFGAALSSIFAITKAGTFFVSLAKSTGIAASGITLFRGILNKIPGVSVKVSKSLALITGSSVALTKASTITKAGIDKLNKALSAVTKGKISLTPKGLKEVGKAAVNTAQGVVLLRAGVQNLSSGFGPLGKITSTVTRQLFSMRTAFVALAGVGGIVAVGKSAVTAAAQMEDFETRLIALTKSPVIAQQKLEALSNFAARAPFELPAIIEAGVTLEAFGLKAEAGIEPLGDLAAFMGVDIVDAAQAMGRGFAAGAGAADILRERGVLNLVKMRTGIDDLTKLSLPQFRKALIESITDPAGKIAGATQRLAETFTGQMSMMSDATFQLRRNVGEALLPVLKKLVTERIVPLIKRITEWTKVNKVLLAQKFDKFVKNSIGLLKDFVKWVIKIVPEVTAWWKENKELIFTLTKMLILAEIAVKVSALAVALTGLGKILVGLKVFFSGVLVQLIGAGGLVAAVTALSPQIAILAGTFALLLGFAVGSFISDWIHGMDDLKQSIKEANEEQDRLQKGLSSRLQKISEDTGILVTNMSSFNAAVNDGLLVFDKATGVWVKGANAIKEAGEAQKTLKTNIDFGNESLGKQKEAIEKLAGQLETLGESDLEKLESSLEKKLELVKGNKELELKVEQAHQENLRKLRDKSFQALGVVSKEQIAQQLQDALQNFTNITSTQDSTNREVIRLREGLFNTLKGIAESVGDTQIALGFKPETVLGDIEALHQKLLDTSTGTRKTLLNAAGRTVESLTKATKVELVGFNQTTEVLIGDTINAVANLITNLTQTQVKGSDKLIDEIDRYKQAYVTAEEAITKTVEVETENRLNILRRFVKTANGLRLSIPSITPIGDLPVESSINRNSSALSSQNINNNNNQQFNLNFSGDQQGNSIEGNFDMTRRLKQLQTFDASLSF
jgi:hypothetical protein